MNDDYINEVIYQLREHIYPSLGKLLSYDICEKEKLIFSQICKLRLKYYGCTKTVVLKKYRKEKRGNDDLKLSVDWEYDILKYLHQRFSSLRGLNVVKPLAILPNEFIVITEEFAGNKLDAIVVDKVRWISSKEKMWRIESYFFQSGRWLNHFQEFTKRDEVVLFNRDHYLENTREKLASSIKYGLEESLQKKIYRFVDEIFKNIDDQQLDVVGYHSDFTPGNVLANTDEIRVLDFDRFSYRNRYDDLTLFLSTLEVKKSIVGMSYKNIDILKEAFLKGYGAEKLNGEIFRLYMLKNALKSLNTIDIYKNTNNKLIDVMYEKYRKRKRIGLYLKYIDNLVSTEHFL